ncbi:MAG TPA: GatB/YqeY domain-containing protein [Thermoanaerobaculia bacterium]|nr:GatB/YqeY domain-containing protein [Thermoanaerobaculia bacterium]
MTAENKAMGKLTEQIRADLTESMKARTADRTSTLRMLQSALKNEQINAGHELSDEEAMSVIRKAVKQRHDSIEQFTKAGRNELAAKEQAELETLKTYLPAELSEEELEAGLREIITSTGATSKKDLGKVMKEATARFKGRAEGKQIQTIVSRLLP